MSKIKHTLYLKSLKYHLSIKKKIKLLVAWHTVIITGKGNPVNITVNNRGSSLGPNPAINSIMYIIIWLTTSQTEIWRCDRNPSVKHNSCITSILHNAYQQSIACPCERLRLYEAAENWKADWGETLHHSSLSHTSLGRSVQHLYSSTSKSVGHKVGGEMRRLLWCMP